MIVNYDKKFKDVYDFESSTFLNVVNKGFQITEQEIWNKARKYKNPPNINEIYYTEVFEKAIDQYVESFPFLEESNFFMHISGMASYLNYVDEDRDLRFNILTDMEEFETEIYLNKEILDELESKKWSELSYNISTFYNDNNINITKDFSKENIDKCIKFLSDKYKFIDIPKESVEYIIKSEYKITDNLIEEQEIIEETEFEEEMEM